MSSDLDALLATILKFPADDTARLVFADWLDEHGEHDRAEFIRVQVELARLHAAGHGTQPENGPACQVLSFARKQSSPGAQVRLSCAACENAFGAEARERELLTDARRREWGGVACPGCYPTGVGGWRCAECHRTGLAPAEFRRGFVERVRCRMGDVLRRHPLASDFVSVEHTPMAWTLTPWAAGVLAAHPVTRWEIAGAEIEDIPGYGAFVGERESLAALIEPGPYRTPELARTALALAVGRVARRLAGLPEVTP